MSRTLTRELTGAALFWLLTEKRCLLLTVERGFHWGNPDALGVLPDRRLVEVEIKISMSDFRANHKKPHMQGLALGVDSPGLPSIYYFLVPEALVSKVEPELPVYAGLLTARTQSWSNGALVLSVVKQSPRMARRRLTVSQCIQMAKNQSRAFVSEFLKVGQDINWREAQSPPPELEKEE